MRTDFTELRLPPEFAQLFPADQDALFASIRPQISDDVLEDISTGDACFHIEEHFRELVRIRNGIDLDRPIGGEPGEVLLIYRHATDVSPLSLAFCCCALLRCPDLSGNESLFEEYTLSILLGSCLELGDSYLRRLLAYLSWSLQTMEPTDVEYLFHAHAWLIAYSNLDDAEPAVIERFGVWLIETEEQIMPWHSTSWETLPEEAARASVGKSLGTELLGPDQEPVGEEHETASRRAHRNRTFLSISEWGGKRWRQMLQLVVRKTDPDGPLRTYLESFWEPFNP